MIKKVWRLIDSGDCDAPFNMALDEAIAESVINNDKATTLRLYGWNKASLSLGAFQRFTDIDNEYCAKHDIPIVRRPTGGRAILHGKEVTYSFSSRNEGFFEKGLMDSYLIIANAFIKAFTHLDIAVDMKDKKTLGKELIKSPLCFNSVSIGEITYKGKKIIGSAQRRWQRGFLQQGSIPFIIDYQKSAGVFRQDLIDEFGEISKINKSITIDHAKNAIVKGFEEVFGVSLQIESPSQQELDRSQQLLQERHLQSLWVVKADKKICKRSET
ncbi:MAG TPA: lipoate--protein ligase family protein [Nitrospirae bacterium]|nr:lipoate--protein ligase family protein [Nitrospirota bacterium]